MAAAGASDDGEAGGAAAASRAIATGEMIASSLPNPGCAKTAEMVTRRKAITIFEFIL